MESPLCRRSGPSTRIRAKAEAGQPVPDPAREDEMIATRRAWATELGLDGGGVESIFRAVLRFSRRAQQT